MIARHVTPGMHITIQDFITNPVLVEYARTEYGGDRPDGTDTTILTLTAGGRFVDIELDPDHPVHT